MKTVPLDHFISNMHIELSEFQKKYIKKHNDNPENYLLELPKENSGLWMEFFILYVTQGIV